MKYKVGDKVKVRENLIHGEKYGGMTFYMDGWKGEVVTISLINSLGCYEIAEDEDKWAWTDEMFEDVNEENNMNEGDITLFGELEDKGMTVAELLNKTNIETGGLVISIYYPRANFEVTMGYNYINRKSELYKRFIGAYGDMIVDEITFRIRDEKPIIMIKVDYCDE